jgi:hypothetical protein
MQLLTDNPSTGQLCKETTAAAAELNDTLTTTINDRYDWLAFDAHVISEMEVLTHQCRISEIFVRQKEIEQESRKLSNQSARYAKQTKQWIQTIDNFNSALKVQKCLQSMSRSVYLHLADHKIGTGRRTKLGSGYGE